MFIKIMNLLLKAVKVGAILSICLAGSSFLRSCTNKVSGGQGALNSVEKVPANGQIFGIIDDSTLDKVKNAPHAGKIIKLDINSPGGYTSSMMKILDVMDLEQASGNSYECTISGTSASAAAVIAAHCDILIMKGRVKLYFHLTHIGEGREVLEENFSRLPKELFNQLDESDEEIVKSLVVGFGIKATQKDLLKGLFINSKDLKFFMSKDNSVEVKQVYWNKLVEKVNSRKSLSDPVKLCMTPFGMLPCSD